MQLCYRLEIFRFLFDTNNEICCETKGNLLSFQPFYTSRTQNRFFRLCLLVEADQETSISIFGEVSHQPSVNQLLCGRNCASHRIIPPSIGSNFAIQWRTHWLKAVLLHTCSLLGCSSSVLSFYPRTGYFYMLMMLRSVGVGVGVGVAD